MCVLGVCVRCVCVSGMYVLGVCEVCMCVVPTISSKDRLSVAWIGVRYPYHYCYHHHLHCYGRNHYYYHYYVDSPLHLLAPPAGSDRTSSRGWWW